jgi:ribonucleoside-diphosphate reductase alpha chain
LALDYLPPETREGLGIKSIAERTESVQAEVGSNTEQRSLEQPEAPTQTIELGERPTAKVLDAPLCYQCGSKMQPAGSCYVCTSCGSTSGCS